MTVENSEEESITEREEDISYYLSGGRIWLPVRHVYSREDPFIYEGTS